MYSINVLVHLAIAFTYVVTSHGVLGALQALEWRRSMCEQPLSRGVSCLPPHYINVPVRLAVGCLPLRARVKENIPFIGRPLSTSAKIGKNEKRVLTMVH